MKNTNVLLPGGLLMALLLSSAPLAGAAPDLTSAVVPDFRGWESTYYAGWTDWTGLDASGFFALPDDPASNAPFARFTVSGSGTGLTSGGSGVLCTDGLPTPVVQYGGAVGDGPVREVVVQIRTSGAFPASVTLEYIGDVPFNTDPDYLSPAEVIQLAPNEALYRFFAAPTGLPVGTFGTFVDFNVLIEASEGSSPGCVDAIQLDVRHQLSGGSNPTCAATQYELNSLNVFAGIDAGGSSIASDNLIELTASGIPAASFGFFLGSPNLGVAPCHGNCQALCLAGPIARIFPPGLGGSDRSFSTSLDLAAIPLPTGPTAVVAGSTWHFQGWFRDANPMVTSNFTQTVSVVFQ